ncbi:MAG: hypothetical protein RR313_03575 [Anaerovoracaceae bacterium]
MNIGEKSELSLKPMPELSLKPMPELSLKPMSELSQKPMSELSQKPMAKVIMRIIITYRCNLGPKKIKSEFAHRIAKNSGSVSRFTDTNGIQGNNCQNHKRILP